MGENSINIYELSETDIRTKFITPALERAGWDKTTQMREEYPITAGRIDVRTSDRAPKLRADYLLFYKENFPIAVVEAKDANHSEGDGIQQARKYAEMLDVPFIFSSNGLKFVFRNEFITSGEKEVTLSMDEFPSPEELWGIYQEKNPISAERRKVIDEPYSSHKNKRPRYYQMIAINRTCDAIASGQNRILLVMATGTGKTFVAFQIIWRLWKAGLKKRILFLTDRRSLRDQTFTNDFAPFGDHMISLTRQNFDEAHEIYLALYQGLTSEDNADSEDEEIIDNLDPIFERFKPDFFDLVVVDECHRGSARANSQWRRVLDYFSSATQIGLTATPKETEEVSNIDYFGEPIYTYSLKQGIEDGFLAPYRVIRYILDKDIEGYEPYEGETDDNGRVFDRRHYNGQDFDRSLILDQRTKLVAKTVSDYLKKYDCRMEKTIFFCVDQEHAGRLRNALINENPDLDKPNKHYVVRITANDKEGVEQLDNFRDVEEKYPVLVTTSKLLTTGVDIPTVKNIVLDAKIRSMTEFKQIIGRGTRVREELGKLSFTIFDFRGVTELFYDEAFDGPCEQDEAYRPGKESPPSTPRQKEESKERKEKFRVKDVEVKVINKTIQILGPNGRLKMESLTDFRREIRGEYPTLESFLADWNAAERKEVILDKLKAKGIFFSDLVEKLGKDYDPFDIICQIAFDQKLKTRKERARTVRENNHFEQYSEVAKEILNEILTKYAENGLEEIEEPFVLLNLSPIKDHGTPLEIIGKFGGKEDYQKAITELKKALYAA